MTHENWNRLNVEDKRQWIGISDQGKRVILAAKPEESVESNKNDTRITVKFHDYEPVFDDSENCKIDAGVHDMSDLATVATSNVTESKSTNQGRLASTEDRPDALQILKNDGTEQQVDFTINQLLSTTNTVDRSEQEVNHLSATFCENFKASRNLRQSTPKVFGETELEHNRHEMCMRPFPPNDIVEEDHPIPMMMKPLWMSEFLISSCYRINHRSRSIHTLTTWFYNFTPKLTTPRTSMTMVPCRALLIQDN